MCPTSYCKHRPVFRARSLTSRLAGPLKRCEFRSGVWGGAPAEIKIGVISTAKSGLLVTLFLSNMKISGPEHVLHILHTIKLKPDTVQNWAKSIPLHFLQFLEISKGNIY